MKLLKIISFFFVIYLIRRFWQLYKVMQQSAAAQEAIKESLQRQAAQAQKDKSKTDNVVEADFKKID